MYHDRTQDLFPSDPPVFLALRNTIMKRAYPSENVDTETAVQQALEELFEGVDNSGESDVLVSVEEPLFNMIAMSPSLRDQEPWLSETMHETGSESKRLKPGTGRELEQGEGAEFQLNQLALQPIVPRRVKKLQRRKGDMTRRVNDGRKHKAETISAEMDTSQLPITSTGWSGKDYKNRDIDRKRLKTMWLNRTIMKYMDDHGFRQVCYSDAPTSFLDKSKKRFAYRSSIPEWMQEILVEFTNECQSYISQCGDIPQKDADHNLRGDHWYMVTGVDRQVKTEPKKTSFHSAHLVPTESLMRKDGVTMRVIKHAADVFEQRFPALAQRVRNCQAELGKMGYPEDIAKPKYGYWYNYCTNGARGQVKGVMTEPHVDAKNLALMMCCVFVYGAFNHKEKAWLVLWEAKLIIELPPGVVMLYPSSLFTHFNVDICDLNIVTTADGSIPTPQTASPIYGVEGRGSVVLFNQATMFQLGELRETIKEARAAGHATVCDNETFLASLTSEQPSL